MRNLVLSCAFVALTPIPAMAQEVTAPSWAGYYGGVSISEFRGDVKDIIGGLDFPPQKIETKVEGTIFYGHNILFGDNPRESAMVGGVELEYTHGGMAVVGMPDTRFDNIVDIKARVGVASERLMVVGIFGFSHLTFEDPIDKYKQLGANYGLAIDYRITNRMFVGAQYLTRHLIDTPFSTDVRARTKSHSVSVRLGIKF